MTESADVTMTLENYRCFDRAPVTFKIGPGFTAFVGPNNAGKSTLVRLFYELRGLMTATQQHTIKVAMAATGNLQGHARIHGAHDPREILPVTGAHPELFIEFPPTVAARSIRSARLAISFDDDGNTQCRTEFEFVNPHSGAPVDWRAEENIMRGGDGAPAWDVSALDTICKELASSVYIGAARSAAGTGMPNYFDMRVGASFVEKWADWKTGDLKAGQELARRVTEDVRRLLGLTTLEINASASRETLQIVTEKGTQRLNEVGGGFAQLLLCLATVADRKPTYVLIDEPELGLHPTLQIDFLTTLGSYATHGVIFSTHSVGLARSIAERVYVVRRDVEGIRRVSALEDVRSRVEFLGEMSFSAYHELGFESVLLVEGQTDVRVVHQWLRILGMEHQVLVLHMGGTQFVKPGGAAQLEEIKRISSRVSILVDSDRQTPADRMSDSLKAFVDECRILAIRVCVTERRATEHYLTERAVQRAFKQRALTPHEALGDHKGFWGKPQSWRAAQHMTREELMVTDVGPFLESLRPTPRNR